MIWFIFALIFGYITFLFTEQKLQQKTSNIGTLEHQTPTAYLGKFPARLTLLMLFPLLVFMSQHNVNSYTPVAQGFILTALSVAIPQLRGYILHIAIATIILMIYILVLNL